MDKKELSEAISEGIVEGFWKPIACAMLCLVIVGVVVIGIVAYQNYKQQECIESGKCGIPVMASIGVAGVNCYIVVGNETERVDVFHFTARDYQDANARYEQLKTEVNEWLNMEYLNWSIKMLHCR